MKKLAVLIFCILILSAVYYLASPVLPFPPAPPGGLQSDEPSDTESVYRRAYYTNLDRPAVLSYYRNYFRPFRLSFLNRLQLRLNYPPEESQTLIRDQTRSSWLEEIYFPLRDSFFINGFYPTLPTEQININSVHFTNKIIVRYVPSHPVTRLTTLTLAAVCGYWLFREYAKS